MAFVCFAFTLACRNQNRLPHAASNSPPAAAVVATTDAQELRAFAKLYGYVRFFHPSDEAAAVDWNAFAVEGARRVVQAEHREQLRVILSELFTPIAPTLVVYANGEEPALGPGVRGEGGVVVAWQHLGLGSAEGDRYYLSARTGRERGKPNDSPSDWAPVLQSFDAYTLRGKAIRFTGWVRTEAKADADHATLTLNVDRAGGRRGFSDEMSARPIRGHEWREFAIEGTVADDADIVTFGGVVNGDAPVWFDDFGLSVADDPGRWTPVPIANPGFEASTGIDWAMRSTVFDYVLDDDAHSGRRSLRMQRRSAESATVLFPARPGPGEVMEKELGAGLWCRLPLALISENGRTLPHGEGGGWKAADAGSVAGGAEGALRAPRSGPLQSWSHGTRYSTSFRTST